jgi:hypothetical protein
MCRCQHSHAHGVAISSEFTESGSPTRELAAETILRYRRRPYNETTGHQQQCRADRYNLISDIDEEEPGRLAGLFAARNTPSEGRQSPAQVDYQERQ